LTTRPVHSPPPEDWAGAVEEVLGVPVVVTLHGPTAKDKAVRRTSTVARPVVARLSVGLP
jgi:adenylosuccinate synthase